MQESKEIEVVRLMIALYCKKHHGGDGKTLCKDCEELLDYVKFRRSKCPFGDNKPFCANCKIHCYKPSMREKIRSVMRYSGPRIVFVHPVIAMRHLVETKKEQRRMKKESLEESANTNQKKEGITQKAEDAKK